LLAVSVPPRRAQRQLTNVAIKENQQLWEAYGMFWPGRRMRRVRVVRNLARQGLEKRPFILPETTYEFDCNGPGHCAL